MSTLEITPNHHELDAVVCAATAGDEPAFAQLVRRYRGGLLAHCYRMLRSYEEAEDLTQETFLRAWRRRETFRGGSFGAWLYRIATNACLSSLARRPVTTTGGLNLDSTSPHMQQLLERLAATQAEPAAEVVSKETFLTAVQYLPPRQRAALFMRDVLGWSARDTAALLETSIPSVTSALQRARETLRGHLPERGLSIDPRGFGSE